MITTRSIPYFIVVFLSFLIGTTSVHAQGKPKKRAYGEDSLLCVKNLSLVHDLLQENKKQEAILPWKWLFKNCPAATENIYIQGAQIYNFMISREQDSSRKQAFVDTLMMIYDQRIQHFMLKQGFVLGRKGVELYQYRPWSAKEALDILKQSIELEYWNSRPAVMVHYFNLALELQHTGVVDTIRVYQAYDEIRDILDYNVRLNNKDSQLYRDARTDIEQAYNAFSPCDELEARYGPVFMRDTNNVDQMVAIIHAFEQKQCIGAKLYLYLIKRIYDMNPCPATALMTARFYVASSHPIQAVKYLQMVTKSTDTALMYDAFLVLADINLNSFQDNAMASMVSEMAIQLFPDRVAPYLVLGDVYVRSAEGCGVTPLDKYAMYWIAADQYLKVKALDPSLAVLADEKLKDILSHFPEASFLAEKQLKVGDTFRVGCFVEKPTTVKVKP